MIADHRFHALEAVRLSLSVLAHPIQQTASVPSDAVARVTEYFASQERLLRENRELKVRVLEQSAAAQEARLLRAEQAHLLEMSPGRSRYVDSGTIAEVLYNARNPFVGQVTNVGTFTSEVTLVTEKDQSVPVMLVRNGLRAVAVGSGKDGSIDIPFMPVAADIQNGDTFVTSGIDGTYPPGLVVATVASVEKNAAYVFAKVVARPAAGVDNHRYVMVLPLPTLTSARPDAKADDTPRKSAKDRTRARRSQ